MIQRNKFKLAGLGAIVVLFFLVQASYGQQTINRTTQADSLRGCIGQQFTYVWPGQGTLSSRRMKGGGEWGYDISKSPPGGEIEPSGYWKYDSQSFRPTNEYYATIKPMPGRVHELRVTGGLQTGPGDAKGSIEQFFKTDNADRVVFLTTSTLTFGANANLVTLVPLQKVVFELGLVFNANDAVRANGPYWGYGSGNIAIGNGDYIVAVSTKPGETASGKGEATIPGGGPGATMFIHVGSSLSQLGAMHTTLHIRYVWVAGTPPTPTSGSPNLALNRPAKQSSTSQWSQPNDARGAVDGNTSGGFGFHTESEPNPWWQVDLGAVKALAEIHIFNRRDCCSERARTLQVLLSSDGVSWTRVFSNPGTVFGADGTPLRVSVKGLSARFVRLQLAETNYLHLDEVQVFGAETP